MQLMNITFSHPTIAKRFVYNKETNPNKSPDIKKSDLAYIDNPPKNPVDLFTDLMTAANLPAVHMSLATIDIDYGVLNRNVLIRTFNDGFITFRVDKNSRKFTNIAEDPRVAATLVLGPLRYMTETATWQIRLIGDAAQLLPHEIFNLWEKEPLCSKIRNYISKTGYPVEYLRQRRCHDDLLSAYQRGEVFLKQPDTFSAFKIVPNIWIFKKSRDNCIPDVLRYRRLDNGVWIRIMGRAEELDEKQRSAFWKKEPVYSKIRSYICQSGSPVDYKILKLAHDQLLQDYEQEKTALPIVDSYTAFKIIPRCWQFYKERPYCISDRIVYKTANNKHWRVKHIGV